MYYCCCYSNDYDVIMSVLGADITLDSLLININEGFNDSQFCQQDGYEYVVVVIIVIIVIVVIIVIIIVV